MEMKLKKQMSLGVGLSYLSIIIKLATGLMYSPILLHSLGQSQYGVYSLCTSFIGYLTILNAGVNAAYIRFYVQEKTIREENVKRLNGIFFKIFIGLSILALGSGLLISNFSSIIFGSKLTGEEYVLARKCLRLLSLSTSIEIFTCIFSSFIIANERFIFAKIVDIVVSVLYPCISVPLLFRGADCDSIILVHLGISTLTLLIELLYCRKVLKIRFIFEKTDSIFLRNVIQFVGFIFLQSILDQLNWQIDKYILARTHGTAEISIYTVGSTFNNYFLTIGAAASSVFIAEINRAVALKDENRINKLFRKTSQIFTYFFMYFLIAFLIFGNIFILRWAGFEYVKSFTVGWMLMVPVSIVLIIGTAQDIARARNKHQMLICISLVVCVLNALISIPLSINWGAVGSAFGTFLAEMIICFIVCPIYYYKEVNLNIGDIVSDFIRFLPGILIPISFGYLITFTGVLKATYFSIILYGVIYTILYGVSILFFSMNKKDREIWLRLVIGGKKDD